MTTTSIPEEVGTYNIWAYKSRKADPGTEPIALCRSCKCRVSLSHACEKCGFFYCEDCDKWATKGAFHCEECFGK